MEINFLQSKAMWNRYRKDPSVSHRCPKPDHMKHLEGRRHPKRPTREAVFTIGV